MNKTDKKTLLVTSLICLIPLIAGALVYDRLPEQVATHFNFAGEPDGWSSRGMAAFGIPGLLLGLHVLIWLGIGSDPKKQNIAGPMRHLTNWMIPMLSLLVCSLTLLNAMGVAAPVERIVPILVGLLFVFIGNYMPKTKQSYTTGIKLPWTLHSEENWNRTHRLAGFLWVLCGVAFIVLSLLKAWNGLLFGLLIGAMVLVPVVYSYLLYRKGI